MRTAHRAVWHSGGLQAYKWLRMGSGHDANKYQSSPQHCHDDLLPTWAFHMKLQGCELLCSTLYRVKQYSLLVHSLHARWVEFYVKLGTRSSARANLHALTIHP